MIGDKLIGIGVFLQYASEVPKGCPTDRPHGEWILECDSEGEGSNLYYCSECGCDYSCQEYDKPNFCPGCGARMTPYKSDGE